MTANSRQLPSAAAFGLLSASLLWSSVCRASDPAVPALAPYGAVPSARHIDWHERRFYAFVHFNMNTFTGLEWGDGRETPDRFNPSQLDCRQWCRVFKECGLSGVILTAKHHDGFCLWPSRFTEHDVANSLWREGQGDVVRELAEACRANGLWVGVYISPWDRNNPLYGKDDAAYNDYYAGQLEELLTNYGPLAEVWWDGANGDVGNPERHQEYDWRRFVAVVRRLQPNAAIFAPPVAHGDIRWVGNEAGRAGVTQWATYPAGVAEDPATLNTGIEGAAVWMPAETDVSIRPGWYWTKESNDKVKSLRELLKIYDESVGRNTNLLLNFPVDDRGLVHEADVARLQELALVLRETFRTNLATERPAAATSVCDVDHGPEAALDGDANTFWAAADGAHSATLDVSLPAGTVVNLALMQEQITLGQRVRRWTIDARVDAQWRRIASGTTIGHLRYCRFPAVTADAVRLSIDDSRAPPTIKSFELYCAPDFDARGAAPADN